ncbi:Shedu immune nuclease family protein [Agrobacterium sp. lyk4-40-TYG-31]|uniref:Shedu immune nuclease family protein n=1 Tax=Agrobacterium sp. lyk4-40-TYG-31 TaxID=3040276 RepID=UPI000DD5F847|nr:Shedu immune nuclease family protein [Agrobacterium sp. lyk4-40-TYG-31]
MIDIHKDGDTLILTYDPAGWRDPEWVTREFEKGEDVSFVKTFTLGKADLINDPTDPKNMGEPVYEFMLGYNEEGYYRIHSGFVGTQKDVLLHRSLNIRKEMFVAAAQIAIFPKLSDLVGGSEIVIGGDREEAMPESDFESLVRSFPNSTEQRKYVSSTIGRLLKDHFSLKSDPEKSFDEFVRKRRGDKVTTYKSEVAEVEIEKYTFIRDEISRLLLTSEAYDERAWQKLILRFILVLFPKYLYAVEEVYIQDTFLGKKRRIDILLIDVDGYVDLIEIKKPQENFLITSNASSASRNNFTPRKGLSDTIIQAEKYLYHLGKAGPAGEKEITEKLRKKRLIGQDLDVRVASPKAIVIAGRSNQLSDHQRFDFQIIKRHYANMMEILSYDDLLLRLDRIIEKFRHQL